LYLGDAKGASVAFIEMTAETCGTIARTVAHSPIERVSCGDSFAALAPQWLELEANGVATPYQTFDWSRTYAETAGAATGVEPLLVAGADGSGRIVAILPLGIRRKAGFAVASFLGDKHSNINLGLFDRHAMPRLTRTDVAFMLRQAALSRGVDFYRLRNQPLSYEGFDNPLALLPTIACPISCWTTQLQADGEAMIRELRSSESLKKLRAKARKLGEIGPLSYVQADDAASIAALLAAFLAQKGDQFRRMGVSDPYDDAGIRSFLHRSMQPREGRNPPVSLWALKAGERVTAVFAAATHAGRRTGMFMSYDSDPAVARCSPGELLLQHVIRVSCKEGLDNFDLGTGDGPYKKDYCPMPKPLFFSVLPMTPKGRVAALALSSALRVKGAMQRNPRAVRAIERLRRAKAQLRRG
jgi:CelD/BcsL family acetyltransferase involved in cellulose biosynthesis